MYVGSPVYLVFVCLYPGGNNGSGPPFHLKSPGFYLCPLGLKCPNLSIPESKNKIFPKTGENHDLVVMRGDSWVDDFF